jgi:D-alanyl-D-alanine dipeptidase
MGTPYDSFAALSEPRYEAKFLAEGKLSALQVENRRTLRTAMETGGFKHISNEWWHFDGQSREAIVTNKKLKIVE